MLKDVEAILERLLWALQYDKGEHGTTKEHPYLQVGEFSGASPRELLESRFGRQFECHWMNQRFVGV